MRLAIVILRERPLADKVVLEGWNIDHTIFTEVEVFSDWVIILRKNNLTGKIEYETVNKVRDVIILK